MSLPFSLTYLSSPELFVLLRMGGRCPAMKRNSFYRQVPFNTHTHTTHTHTYSCRWEPQFRTISRSCRSIAEPLYDAGVQWNRKRVHNGHAVERRTRQLRPSNDHPVIDTLVLFFDNGTILKLIRCRIKSLSSRDRFAGIYGHRAYSVR